MSSPSLCFFVVLAVFVSASSAIKCFTCNSHFDKGCERPTGLERFLTECDMSPEGLKYTVCRKIDQDLPNHEGVENKIRTIRECGTDDPVTNTCYQKAGFGGRQYVCSCDADGCNSGSNLKIALATLSSFVFVALIGPKFLL